MMSARRESARGTKVGRRAQTTQTFGARARTTQATLTEHDLAGGIERDIRLMTVHADGWAAWTTRAVTACATIAGATTRAPLPRSLPLRRSRETTTRSTKTSRSTVDASATITTRAGRDAQVRHREPRGVDQEESERSPSILTSAASFAAATTRSARTATSADGRTREDRRAATPGASASASSVIAICAGSSQDVISRRPFAVGDVELEHLRGTIGAIRFGAVGT